MHEITVSKLSSGTLFKIVIIGLLFSLVPLFFVLGLATWLGVGSIQWNGRSLHGLAAIFMSPLIGVLLAIMLAFLLGSLMALGLWVYAWLRPIRLRYYASLGTLTNGRSADYF